MLYKSIFQPRQLNSVYLLDQIHDMNHIELIAKYQEQNFDFYLIKMTNLNYHRKTLKWNIELFRSPRSFDMKNYCWGNYLNENVYEQDLSPWLFRRGGYLTPNNKEKTRGSHQFKLQNLNMILFKNMWIEPTTKYMTFSKTT